MEANTHAYLKSWSDELSARRNRVRNLIGDAHWLTDGGHKEALLREFFQRYLPEECQCSTGFVRSASGTPFCSNEIDILLYSRRLHIPYFCEGSVSIVDPCSVLATVEVKSTLNAAALEAAILNVASVRGLIKSSGNEVNNSWSGIFFFDVPESRTPESCLETLQATLQKIALASPRDLLPSCVVLGPSWVVFPDVNDGRIRLRLFDRADFSFASAICDLFSHVSSRIGPIGQTGFDVWSAQSGSSLLAREF